MRGLLLLVLALAVAAPGRADTILYATAANKNRIDGFCLRGDGSLASSPAIQVPTGIEPRRLLVHNGVLYVAERDQVEVFQILAGGGLTPLRGSGIQNQMDPRDLAVAPEGTTPTLYVPQNGGGNLQRIVAYPLEADGSLPEDPTPDDPTVDHPFTCVQGTLNDTYQQIILRQISGGAGVMYVASDPPFIDSATVKVYPFAADGTLPAAPSDCVGSSVGDRPPPTTPVTRRSVFYGARSIQLNPEGTVLYTEQEFARQVSTFAVDPTTGLFVTGDKLRSQGICSVSGTKCKNDSKCPTGETCDKEFKPKRATSVTEPDKPYRTILLNKNTILGTVWGGQIDAIGVKPDGRIKQKAISTNKDVRTSPTRMAVHENILYVASGLRNQVQAFTLAPTSGEFTHGLPFSTTLQLENSFPNDVAIAVLTGSCS